MDFTVIVIDMMTTANTNFAVIIIIAIVIVVVVVLSLSWSYLWFTIETPLQSIQITLQIDLHTLETTNLFSQFILENNIIYLLYIFLIPIYAHDKIIILSLCSDSR